MTEWNRKDVVIKTPRRHGKSTRQEAYLKLVDDFWARFHAVLSDEMLKNLEGLS